MPRYELNEGGHWYDNVDADSIEDALQQAKDNVDRSNYPTEKGETDGTMWIDVRVREVCTNDECAASGTCACDLATDRASVTLDPDEPECSDDQEHDWQAPLAIVGGIKENPGVWGHGGGTVSWEACLRCGCGRKTDTWAQRRDTGEQGLTSVTYEPGKYADEIRGCGEYETGSGQRGDECESGDR